jgi:hypothetical protein
LTEAKEEGLERILSIEFLTAFLNFISSPGVLFPYPSEISIRSNELHL